MCVLVAASPVQVGHQRRHTTLLQQPSSTDITALQPCPSKSRKANKPTASNDRQSYGSRPAGCAADANFGNSLVSVGPTHRCLSATGAKSVASHDETDARCGKTPMPNRRSVLAAPARLLQLLLLMLPLLLQPLAPHGARSSRNDSVLLASNSSRTAAVLADPKHQQYPRNRQNWSQHGPPSRHTTPSSRRQIR